MEKITNKASSIKDKLKNIAKKQKIMPQLIYLSYVFGRFLYRVSKSEYRDNFILKGGVLLYCIDVNIRQTTDIDFLVQDISKSKLKMKSIIREICLIDGQDPIIFDVKNISIKNTMVAQNYKGCKVVIPYTFSTMRENLQIDIGFNDIVYPKPKKFTYPSLLNEKSFTVKGYTVETFIAEKIHSIYSWGIKTSRMKDYYDLFKLSELRSFKQIVLLKAIFTTFKKRKSTITSEYLLDILNENL
ncbi:MAG: nucleotidyl transferase AbiEii/AbiGii toxin family protein [Promethearchaeota archaeon]